MDRLSNCSVPLVRSTRTVASTSLAKTHRNCCFCWTLIIDYRIAFIYSVNCWLQFILPYTGVVYLTLFWIFTSPGAVPKCCDEYVCLYVCLSTRISLKNTRDLYQIFVHVANVRGSVVLRHADDRPHRQSAGKGWRECIAWTMCNLRLPCYNFIFVLHQLHIRIIIHY